MNEINDLSGEFTDDFLHAQADSGDYLLDEEGFQYRPTQDEMKKLAREGLSLLFIDCLKANNHGAFRQPRNSRLVDFDRDPFFSKVISINR